MTVAASAHTAAAEPNGFPAKTRWAIAGSWGLFWALMIAVAIQDYLRSGGTQIWQPVLWESSSALSITFLLLLQRRYTRRFDRLLATPPRWFGIQMLCLPVQWILFVPLAFGLRHGVYQLAGSVYHHPPWPQIFFYESIKLSLFLLLFYVILFGILSYQGLVNERLRAQRSDSLMRQAQLQQLAQQMQPHFLFNALNTVSSLMHTDVARADAVLVELADVLRATLDAGGQQQVALHTELQLARGYAHLMSERFADRVLIDWHIADDSVACLVPLFSIQPLLENIFKHTVESSRHMTHIVVATERVGPRLSLTVEDDSGSMRAPATPGIGLGNLRQRLEFLYGSAAALTLDPLTPRGVRARITLPCAS